MIIRHLEVLMNVAITGITGMVGSHFIKKLFKQSADGDKPNVQIGRAHV